MTYTADGKYEVPAPAEDQCPECRCAPGQPHSPDCTEAERPARTPTLMLNTDREMETVDIDDLVIIPLDIQEWFFEAGKYEAAMKLVDLVGALDTNPVELFALARTRLRSGFEDYHSAMFAWDAETRRRNVMEELADALVYLISGPIK